MIKLDHFAMFVVDLEGAREFFEKYFNAKAGEYYENPRTHFKSYFLTFDDYSRLEISTRPEVAGLSPNFEEYRLGFIHLALSVGGQEMVDELSARLSADGYRIISGPRLTGDGYYECDIEGPEGNILELIE